MTGKRRPDSRTVLLVNPSDEHGLGRLDELENAHRAAFAAFARPTSEPDRRAAIALGGHSIGPTANPELARRVYEAQEGTIDLVPGRGSIACVVSCPSGESFSGATSVELAVKDGLGYMKYTRSPDAAERGEVTLIGVLPAGAGDLRVKTVLSGTIPVVLTADGAYWITTREGEDVYWTGSDGTIHQHTFGRFRGHFFESE